jgi:hypothetical protein
MLIETMIEFAVANIDAKRLDAAVRAVQDAMRRTRDASHRAVALHEVQLLQGNTLLFSVRVSGSETEKQFIYNMETGTVFPYSANLSHMDLNDPSRTQ